MADPTQTLQRELLDDAGVFDSLEAAQAAVDAFLHEYNTNRPYQALDMAFPADRFRPNTAVPAAGDGAELIGLRLPAFLARCHRQHRSGSRID